MRHPTRATALAVALATGSAIVLVATAQPAAANTTTVTLQPTVWAYTDSQQPKKAFLNPTGDAPLGTVVDASGATHTRRSYFTFDLSSIKGQVVHTATLYSHETDVTDCSAPATLELWRTGRVTPGTTWQRPPAEVELIQQASYGSGSCPSYFGHNAVDLLNQALARNDKTLTVELRITQSQEADPRLGRSMAVPQIGVFANYVPVVSGEALTGPDRPCGTPTHNPGANNSTTFTATVTDADAHSSLGMRFAIWPASQPDQRREFSGGTGYDGVSQASIDLSGYANGTLMAWAAQGYDYYDSSPWSRPCYLTIDKDAPKTAPVVTSDVYEPGTTFPGYGGQGVPGTFRFDAKGDRDVVMFSWTSPSGMSGYVTADHPGGQATITYTPPNNGPQWIDVTPFDEATNRGPTTRYSFVVRMSAPMISVDVAGVGLTSHLTLSSPTAEVTGFDYQIDGGPVTRLPATNGVARGDVVFTKSGGPTITARSYIGDELAGVTTQGVQVSDAPGVASEQFSLDPDAVAGQPGSFTFTPRTTNVVAYQYDFGDGLQQRIPANADGTAVLAWTPDAGGYYDLIVQSISADGTTSEPTEYPFIVIDASY